MDYQKTFKSFNNHLPAQLIQTANDGHNSLIKAINKMISTGDPPEEPFSPTETQYLLNQLAMMDTNNFREKIGVGEREGRVLSSTLKNRYFGLTHGIGRSGELLAIQPKAAGSSLLQKVTHRMLMRILKDVFGLGGFKGALILPVATGMALNLCLMNLRLKRRKRNKVVFLRIDQKSCIKAVLALGFEILFVENVWEKQNVELQSLESNTDCGENKTKSEMQGIPGLSTDFSSLRSILEEHKEDILCVVSTTSCFAPRNPDDVIEVGNLAREYQVFHLVNNAYGLQCFKTVHMINRAISKGLIDYVVQSTDKNFCVPVGGSVGKKSEYTITNYL